MEVCCSEHLSARMRGDALRAGSSLHLRTLPLVDQVYVTSFS